MSLINIRNSNGPSTDPCGTPARWERTKGVRTKALWYKSPLGQKPIGQYPTGQKPTAKCVSVDESPLL